MTIKDLLFPKLKVTATTMVVLVLIVLPLRAEDIYLRRENGIVKLTEEPERDDFAFLRQSDQPEEQDLPGLNELEDIIEENADRFDLPEILIYSVIMMESGGDSSALSEAGAQGLMQLMPRTAESLGVKDVWEPAENIRGGSKYLSRMLARYDGDLDLALAAYNAGPGAVDEHDGIPPFPETQHFVEATRNSFEDLRRDQDKIFVYRDSRGIINITNIK